MKDNGGSAFPAMKIHSKEVLDYGNQPVGVLTRTDNEGGMSLRDWFAGMVAAGFVQANPKQLDAQVAAWSYEIADAMIAERDKEVHNDEERT